MKRKLLLLGLLIPLFAYSETDLVLVPMSGQDLNYAVSLIGQIRFVENSVCLYDKQDAELGCTPINEINKIVFAEKPNTTTSINDTNSGTSLQIIFDPSQESLVVRGLQGKQTLRIYNLNGQLIQSITAIGSDAYLHVGGLQNGAYLLQIGAQIVKFLKD